jgi:hypothetical protein
LKYFALLKSVITPMNRYACLLMICGCMLAGNLSAVDSRVTHGKETFQAEEEEKMDTLSLVSYIASVGGLVALFLLPQVAAILMLGGFIGGLVAVASAKRRFRNRKGRGLAIAAMVVGGIMPALFILYLLALGI